MPNDPPKMVRLVEHLAEQKTFHAQRNALLAEREDLLRKKQENHEVLISCREQVTNAKTAAFKGEGYADKQWFNAVTNKLRHVRKRDPDLATPLRPRPAQEVTPNAPLELSASRHPGSRGPPPDRACVAGRGDPAAPPA
jgi:hypothetical protein